MESCLVSRSRITEKVALPGWSEGVFATFGLGVNYKYSPTSASTAAQLDAV